MFLSVPKAIEGDRVQGLPRCPGRAGEGKRGGSGSAHKGQALVSKTMKGSLRLCEDTLKFCGAKTWPERRSASPPCGAGVSEPSLSTSRSLVPPPRSAPEAGGSTLQARLGHSMFLCILLAFQSKVEAIWQLPGLFSGTVALPHAAVCGAGRGLRGEHDRDWTLHAANNV